MNRPARAAVLCLLVGAALLAPRTAEAQYTRYLGVSTISACGITQNGELHCIFGGSEYQPFAGNRFKAIALGGSYGTVCAIRVDDATMCSGYDPGFFGPLIAGGPYKSISVGIDASAACGVTLDGRMKCFGNDAGDGF